MTIKYHLVDREDELLKLVKILSAARSDELIALDTEFLRIHTFYPKLCLLQIAYQGEAYIIDPFPLDLEPLIRFFYDTDAQILTFAGAEDWECLSYEFLKLGFSERLTPKHPLDAQLLAAFSNHSWGIGLSSMVKDLLDIELAKDQTLSDWEYRPLSKEQLVYASLDVVYLEKIHELLKQRVSDTIYSYYVEEVLDRAQKICNEDDEETFYRQVPGAGRLNLADLNLLHELCVKRLNFAKRQNCALSRLCPIGSLVSIVKKKPRSKQMLLKLNLKPQCIRMYGDLILSWLNDATHQKKVLLDLKAPYDACTQYVSYGLVVNKLKTLAQEKCEALNLSSKLLTSKKLINLTVTAYLEGKHEGLATGWKREVLGPIDEILELCKNEHLEKNNPQQDAKEES